MQPLLVRPARFLTAGAFLEEIRGGLIFVLSPLFASNPTTRNFEPRLGFAWDPKGDGKMAVRGGFAIFDVLPLPGYFFTQSWMPFFLTAPS